MTKIPLKKRIRKYLVRNFIGHHRFRFVGCRFRIRRHVRMGLIAVMLQFMILMTISALEWPSLLKVTGLVPILAYGFVLLYYFHAWPVQLIELDDEQIEDWDDEDDGMRPTPTIKVT